MTPDEAAALLGVTIDTVYRNIRSGHLRATRTQHRYDIRAEAAAAWKTAAHTRRREACRMRAEERAPARFWTLVERRGQDECRPYRGGVNAGRGVFHIGRYDYSSPQTMAYTLTNGVLPAGMVALETCGDPMCANPAHIALVPRNTIWRRRRVQTNERLPDEAVQAIRSAILVPRGAKPQPGQTTVTALSKQYGISRQWVYLIRAGKAYTAVP